MPLIRIWEVVHMELQKEKKAEFISAQLIRIGLEG
nr:MAG TPA: hypothetical protein [Caudoviricetes sp.]